MAHKNYSEDLNTIQTMLGTISNMSRLNESLVFEDDDFETEPEFSDSEEAAMMDNDVQEIPQADINGVQQGQAMEKMDPEEAGMEELDEMGEIDKIREITLSGMHKLCKNPQDPKYQALKKIFQMCDKGVEEDIKNQQQA